MKLRRLVQPFFFAGLAVTVFIQEASETPYTRNREGIARTIFLIATPLLCAALGALVAPKERASWRRFVFLTPMAGALNGFICSWGYQLSRPAFPFMEECIASSFLATIPGALMSITFVPALALVVLSTTSAREEARNGSIYDRASRRGVWASVLTAVAGVSLLAAALRAQGSGSFSPLMTTIAPVVAALGLMTILGLHVRSLRRVRMLEGRAGRLHAEVEPIEKVVDYGVGDEAIKEVEASPNPYRENDTVVRVYVGDASIAARWLLIQSACATVGLLLALTALAIRPASGYRSQTMGNRLNDDYAIAHSDDAMATIQLRLHNCDHTISFTRLRNYAIALPQR